MLNEKFSSISVSPVLRIPPITLFFMSITWSVVNLILNSKFNSASHEFIGCNVPLNKFLNQIWNQLKIGNTRCENDGMRLLNLDISEGNRGIKTPKINTRLLRMMIRCFMKEEFIEIWEFSLNEGIFKVLILIVHFTYSNDESCKEIYVLTLHGLHVCYDFWELFTDL